MIYLRFEICREDAPSPPSDAEKAYGEFLFELDDPRECTQRAVTLLREQSWRAVKVVDACESYTFEDLRGTERFLAHVREGGRQTTYLLDVPELVEAR